MKEACWMPPAGLSWRETGCLSLEKLPNPLCQFGSCCWCMMGKKNIPPSLLYPLRKAPWPEFRFTWIISSRWGRHDFLYLSYQILLLDIQGEILVDWGRQLDALSVRTGCENSRKQAASAEKTEGKTSKMWLRSWELQPQIHSHTGNHNTF